MIERYETLKAEILEKSDRWRTAMDLGWLAIDHTFVEGFSEEDAQTICETNSHWEYREARIRWYMASASRLTEKELDLTVLHELVHTITDPMEKHVKNAYSEQCEYVVTCISKAILATRDYYEAPAGSRLPMSFNEALER